MSNDHLPADERVFKGRPVRLIMPWGVVYNTGDYKGELYQVATKAAAKSTAAGMPRSANAKVVQLVAFEVKR